VPVTVAVGSLNPVKVGAARTAVEAIFAATVTAVQVTSGVPDQPWGDDVTRIGARTRARSALRAVAGATIGIGIEAGLIARDGCVESMSWVVALGAALHGESRTASYLLPREIADLVLDSSSLGAATDIVFSGNGLSRSTGTVGPLTGGLIDRRSHYVAALTLALIPFNPRNDALEFPCPSANLEN
jgi:inosine/xanthosine triphosphatase